MQAPHFMQIPVIFDTSSLSIDPIGQTSTHVLQSVHVVFVLGLIFLKSYKFPSMSLGL